MLLVSHPDSWGSLWTMAAGFVWAQLSATYPGALSLACGASCLTH